MAIIYTSTRLIEIITKELCFLNIIIYNENVTATQEMYI